MNITEKHEKLKEAEEIYRQAKQRVDSARSAECDALNRLNEAQKAFDDAVAAIKDKSPAGDWKRLPSSVCAV